MTEPNKYGTRVGDTVVNRSPDLTPTPKTFWGTVVGSPIGGAIAVLLIEVLEGNGVILSNTAEGAIHTLIQAAVAFVAMYLTPPAGWGGNYGKVAAVPFVLFLVGAGLGACSMLPGQTQPETARQQLLAAEYQTAGALGVARNLVETGAIKGDDLRTLDNLQRNVGASLDTARQVINQGGSGVSQLQLANAALTRLISYLEERKRGKSSSGLASPERTAYLGIRGADCGLTDLYGNRKSAA